MNIEFPFNKDVENAQEKILQAKSAQEIKDLLKQDDPLHPNYQEGLIRLVSQHIMKQFTPEEIAKVENIPFQDLDAKFSQERSIEFSNLSHRFMDNTTEFLIVDDAAQKQDPYRVPKEKRDSFQPPTVGLSIIYSTQVHLKNYPQAVEDIFDNILPKIKQDKHEIEIARKAGYVQGVCECVAAIGDDHTLGKKLLNEMNVNKDMAQKYANQETFKVLEQGIFAQKQEQNLEQTQGFKR